MELLICSPSACVGSTNQWEATQSSSSLARYILRPVQSEFFRAQKWSRLRVGSETAEVQLVV